VDPTDVARPDMMGGKRDGGVGLLCRGIVFLELNDVRRGEQRDGKSCFGVRKRRLSGSNTKLNAADGRQP
jgi:hypothetical protein